MIQNRTSSSNETQKREGTRCHICTGCGRCFAEKENLQILTVIEEQEELIMANQEGHRLVVADIGTTTIAMLLYDVKGQVVDRFVKVNPQTVYGADVLSRIQAAECQEAAGKMQNMVQEVLAEGLEKLGQHIAPEESLIMMIAANTTMVYLLMGWNPAELGKAPFQASHLDMVETVVADVPTIILPGLSAFVGGDIVAGMYAYDIWHREKPILLIDLGTNGEMVLGNRDKILASATAAGPAFEGGVNKGVWGSDMVGLIAKLLELGLVDETGLLAEPYFDEGVMIGNVHVTQASIRAIQLAKGAVMAGIKVLSEKYGIAIEEIDEVILAGGFGYYLNPEQACAIGLLPEALLGKTKAGGNTALSGARQLGCTLLNGNIYLIDLWKRDMSEAKLEIVNLAKEKGFEDAFIYAMEIKKQ